MIAERMAADGFLTPDDLAAHRGEWGEPIATTYRGFTVYETPPPTQGITALMALNMLEGVPLAKLPLHSAEHLHLLLEITKLAYADRDRWIGDPAQAHVPVEALLDKAYAAARLKLFDPRKAGLYSPGDPDGDTTGFVVADGQGNIVSVIQSLFNAFGSGVVPPGTGVLPAEPRPSLHDGPVASQRAGAGQAAVPHPDGLDQHARRPAGDGLCHHGRQRTGDVPRPGADQRLRLRARHPGGDRAARAFSSAPSCPDEPGDLIRLESRVPARVFAALKRRGHGITPAPELYYRVGHAHGVTVSTDGVLTGGADPRGDGVALGF